MLITVAAIIALGLVVLDSAASIKTNNYVERQLLFVMLGVSAVLIFLKFDYSVLKSCFPWKNSELGQMKADSMRVPFQGMDRQVR